MWCLKLSLLNVFFQDSSWFWMWFTATSNEEREREKKTTRTKSFDLPKFTNKLSALRFSIFPFALRGQFIHSGSCVNNFFFYSPLLTARYTLYGAMREILSTTEPVIHVNWIQHFFFLLFFRFIPTFACSFFLTRKSNMHRAKLIVRREHICRAQTVWIADSCRIVKCWWWWEAQLHFPNTSETESDCKLRLNSEFSSGWMTPFALRCKDKREIVKTCDRRDGGRRYRFTVVISLVTTVTVSYNFHASTRFQIELLIYSIRFESQHNNTESVSMDFERFFPLLFRTNWTLSSHSRNVTSKFTHLRE